MLSYILIFLAVSAFTCLYLFFHSVFSMLFSHLFRRLDMELTNKKDREPM